MPFQLLNTLRHVFTGHGGRDHVSRHAAGDTGSGAGEQSVVLRQVRHINPDAPGHPLATAGQQAATAGSFSEAPAVDWHNLDQVMDHLAASSRGMLGEHSPVRESLFSPKGLVFGNLQAFSARTVADLALVLPEGHPILSMARDLPKTVAQKLMERRRKYGDEPPAVERFIAMRALHLAFRQMSLEAERLATKWGHKREGCFEHQFYSGLHAHFEAFKRNILTKTVPYHYHAWAALATKEFAATAQAGGFGDAVKLSKWFGLRGGGGIDGGPTLAGEIQVAKDEQLSIDADGDREYFNAMRYVFGFLASIGLPGLEKSLGLKGTAQVIATRGAYSVGPNLEQAAAAHAKTQFDHKSFLQRAKDVLTFQRSTSASGGAQARAAAFNDMSRWLNKVFGGNAIRHPDGGIAKPGYATEAKMAKGNNNYLLHARAYELDRLLHAHGKPSNFYGSTRLAAPSRFEQLGGIEQIDDHTAELLQQALLDTPKALISAPTGQSTRDGRPAGNNYTDVAFKARLDAVFKLLNLPVDMAQTQANLAAALTGTKPKSIKPNAVLDALSFAANFEFAAQQRVYKLQRALTTNLIGCQDLETRLAILSEVQAQHQRNAPPGMLPPSMTVHRRFNPLNDLIPLSPHYNQLVAGKPGESLVGDRSKFSPEINWFLHQLSTGDVPLLWLAAPLCGSYEQLFEERKRLEMWSEIALHPETPEGQECLRMLNLCCWNGQYPVDEIRNTSDAQRFLASTAAQYDYTAAWLNDMMFMAKMAAPQVLEGQDRETFRLIGERFNLARKSYDELSKFMGGDMDAAKAYPLSMVLPQGVSDRIQVNATLGGKVGLVPIGAAASSLGGVAKDAAGAALDNITVGGIQGSAAVNFATVLHPNPNARSGLFWTVTALLGAGAPVAHVLKFVDGVIRRGQALTKSDSEAAFMVASALQGVLESGEAALKRAPPLHLVAGTDTVGVQVRTRQHLPGDGNSSSTMVQAIETVKRQAYSLSAAAPVGAAIAPGVVLTPSMGRSGEVTIVRGTWVNDPNYIAMQFKSDEGPGKLVKRNADGSIDVAATREAFARPENEPLLYMMFGPADPVAQVVKSAKRFADEFRQGEAIDSPFGPYYLKADLRRHVLNLQMNKHYAGGMAEPLHADNATPPIDKLFGDLRGEPERALKTRPSYRRDPMALLDDYLQNNLHTLETFCRVCDTVNEIDSAEKGITGYKPTVNPYYVDGIAYRQPAMAMVGAQPIRGRDIRVTAEFVHARAGNLPINQSGAEFSPGRLNGFGCAAS